MADGRITARKSNCPFAFLPVLKTPEKLVGVGFRSWIAGYQTGEIACWEEAWKAYSDALGQASARTVVIMLACWVRSITDEAHRDIKVFPAGCRGFCHDECVAISMIAACQHDAYPIIKRCALALLECSNMNVVVDGARSLAEALKSANQVLSPSSIWTAAHLQALSAAHLGHSGADNIGHICDSG